MTYRYALGLLLLAPAAHGQTAPASPGLTLPAADTLLVQGQPQPTRPFLTVQDQLRTVAGVQVTPYDGSPGSGQVLRIRGAGVAQRQGQPLYVVDGLPALYDELTPDAVAGPVQPYLPPHNDYDTQLGFTYQYTLAERHQEIGASPLQLLPPEAIASVEVLAGPAAVARYGSLGANGVVSIRTRPGLRQPGRPLRLTYSAYGGVQQVRHRYDLLQAPEFAALQNEVDRQSGSYQTYNPVPAGLGTDWQAETYRPAGLQQHQLSLSGQWHRTGWLLSGDYRQQAGVLRGSELSRYGLRAALDQTVGKRLHLRGTLALGETSQRLPDTEGLYGATRAALLAPPTAAVRTAQGTWNRLATGGFFISNPLVVTDGIYRQPTTQRLLTQLSADYHPLPGLTVEAGANFARTVLKAGYFWQLPLNDSVLTASRRYGNQQYYGSFWAARLAVRYEHRLGRHHLLGAEAEYNRQAFWFFSRINYYFSSGTGELANNEDSQQAGTSRSGYYGYYGAEVRQPTLHRPWGRLYYRLDSVLDVEASLGYNRYGDDYPYTGWYPAAQVSWHPRLAALAACGLSPTLWLGASRTSLLGYTFTYGAPAVLDVPGFSPFDPNARRQQPYRTDQLEAGLRLGQPTGHLSAQLVAYQRLSYQVMLSRTLPSRYTPPIPLADEGTIRNQGLELTLAGTWAAGPVQGSTRLVAAFNRNRLQGDQYATQSGYFPQADGQPTGAFYGYQLTGLSATGQPQYAGASAGSLFGLAQVLGNPVPGQLLSASQQLGWRRLSLDVQLDAMLGYQVLNYQRIDLDTPEGYHNNATTVRDRWTPTHTDTRIPAAGVHDQQGYYSGTDFELVNSRLLENGSHLRLSSLTVAYALAQRGTQQLSLWAGVQNLFVLTSYRGYDPNVSSGGSVPLLAGRDLGAVPVPRTWLLGVRAAL